MVNKRISVVIVAVMLCYMYVVQAVDYNGLCSSTRDCTQDTGMVCAVEYTACDIGVCRCGKTESWDEEKCQPKLSAGSACTATRTDLPEHSSCVDEKVKCDDGYTAYSGNEYYHGDQCGRGTKRLGEECSRANDCYQHNSFCEPVSGTSKSVCACWTNSKLINGVCLQAKLGETCTEDLDCGVHESICGTGKTCECKSQLKNYEGECRSDGTLKLGETCVRDVLVGAQTCEPGLWCDVCAGTDRIDGIYKCLKWRVPDNDSDERVPDNDSSGAAIIVPAIINILLTVFLGGIGKTTLV